MLSNTDSASTNVASIAWQTEAMLHTVTYSKVTTLS